MAVGRFPPLPPASFPDGLERQVVDNRAGTTRDRLFAPVEWKVALVSYALSSYRPFSLPAGLLLLAPHSERIVRPRRQRRDRLGRGGGGEQRAERWRGWADRYEQILESERVI